MAEIDEIDAVLRDAFARAARPGDSAGVADAIRSRMASGDTGTLSTGSTAPGFGGGALSWLPWIGVVVAAGIVGTTLGVTGAFGRQTDELLVVGHTAVLDGTAAAAACPGGPVVASLGAGTRVLTIQRSEDSAWLGVRNPNDFGDVLWLANADLLIDPAQSAVSSLPVGPACPEAVAAAIDPAPAPPAIPEPSQPPAPAPPPGPPADTAKPTIGVPTANPNPVYNTDPTTITVTADDNVGVAAVLISWSGEFTGNATMSPVGGQWTYTFTPPNIDVGGDITFTLRARDAVGNLSNPATVVVGHQYFG